MMSSAAISVAASMSDPLATFGWKTLYNRYDAKCRGFSPGSEHLRGIYARIPNDRLLYYALLSQAAENRAKLDMDWLEAVLYWKLYSQPAAVSNIRRWLSAFKGNLQVFLAAVPNRIRRDVSELVGIIEIVGRYQLPGMKSSTSLPVRTAFLHFLFPATVPVFDKMVLKAVDKWTPGANQKIPVLREYVPHAWVLADRYSEQLTSFSETPVRLIDMALWVERGT